MSIKWKLNLTLFFLGMLGILSLLLSPITSSLPDEMFQRFSEFTLQLLVLINPVLYLIIATVLGAFMTEKVELQAPAISRLLKRLPIRDTLLRQGRWGVPLGLAGGGLIVISGFIVEPLLPQAFLEASESVNLAPLTRFLYGGLTEEVLVRWGIMSFFVWLFWKTLGRKREQPMPYMYWAGIIGAALLFGAGHLPIVFSLVEEPGVLLISYIILANAVFGFIAGWLFWKHGLEAAMIAHICAHVVIMIFA